MIVDQDKFLEVCKVCYNQGLKPGVDFELDCLPLVLKYLTHNDLYAPTDFNDWLRGNAERLTEDFTKLLEIEKAKDRTILVTKWLRAAHQQGKQGACDASA